MTNDTHGYIYELLRKLAPKANLTSQIYRRIPEMQKLAADGKDAVNTAGKRPGAAGKNPDTATPMELQKDRQAAWIANPAYVARSMGDQLRFLDGVRQGRSWTSSARSSTTARRPEVGPSSGRPEVNRGALRPGCDKNAAAGSGISCRICAVQAPTS